MHELHKAFLAIPSTKTVKTNRDKLALVVLYSLELCVRAHHHFVTDAGGENIHIQINLEPWRRDGLPTNTSSQEQEEAVWCAAQAYLKEVRESEFGTDVLAQLHQLLLTDRDTDGLGQHFTPPDLCMLIGALKASHERRHPHDLNRIADDCGCGAGGLLLGVLARKYKDGITKYPKPLQKLSVFALDIDPLCCGMTALQLYANRVWHGQPMHQIMVCCGNTLLTKRELMFQYDMHIPQGMKALDVMEAIENRINQNKKKGEENYAHP